MLVIEGSDCSGKTTLATDIAANFDATTVHLGLPPLGHRHWDLVKEALLTQPNNVVYDRMIIGSYVFGSIKPDDHNKFAVTDSELQRWCSLFNRIGGTLVMANAPEDVLLERFRERGDAYINEEELIASAVAYRNVFNKIRHNAMIKNLLLYSSAQETPGLFIGAHSSQLIRALSKRSTTKYANLIRVEM